MSGDSTSEADNIGTPVGVNHVVLNVRDIEAAHRFWTEVIGLKQVGELHPRTDMGPGAQPQMRFYSGDHGGKMTHHDVAIVENPNLPPPPAQWELFGSQAINHIAIAMPDRESWLKRLAFMQSRGIKFNMRINHGVTHSVYVNDPNGYGVELLYEVPRHLWERDIDAGLNYLALLPTEGPEALVDDLENAPSFGKAAEQRAAARRGLGIASHGRHFSHWHDADDQFARYRLTVGATLPIHRHFSVEPYLVRQVDFAGNAAITNAIGLILIAAF